MQRRRYTRNGMASTAAKPEPLFTRGRTASGRLDRCRRGLQELGHILGLRHVFDWPPVRLCGHTRSASGPRRRPNRRVRGRTREVLSVGGDGRRVIASPCLTVAGPRTASCSASTRRAPGSRSSRRRTKTIGKKWRPPKLTGARADILTLARMNLKDRQAAAFVRDLAGWLHKPHGLRDPDPDRATIDKALRGLLYKMSTGEAEFHRRKLRERIDEHRGAGHRPPSPALAAATTSEATTVPDRPSVAPNTEAATFARYLARDVPRPAAMEIMRLIARDVGVDFRASLRESSRRR